MRVSVLAAALTLAAPLVASFAAPPAHAAVLVTVDKSAQTMTVDVDGATKWTWPVSTGIRGYSTPSGDYKANRMEADHYSKEWDEAPMPHSIFFTQEGHAIHGSYAVKRLGHAASHGCVRIAPGNAAKLFALVKHEGLGKTRVVLTGETPGGESDALRSTGSSIADRDVDYYSTPGASIFGSRVRRAPAPARAFYSNEDYDARSRGNFNRGGFYSGGSLFGGRGGGCGADPR